ncbi:hypothetical protein EJ419_07510 [Alloscardovia theropitheci]|uniref:Fibronectin type III-like domain-containing protein n=1 Tax=Alloscardovia theropitheci TaxID=2496842 RepID=A0A4R0QRW5_9BIFI|nr:glycoside hydrolase family 3 C-terminal domain-containing protein [Alloscardovia theropitheci]TCD53805.1 hypothetical protein EJ419_07510 [Alloscardovia theropitheci]
MSKEKKVKIPRRRMSQRAFKTWWITLITLLVIIALAINTAAIMFAPMLDSFLGAGRTQVHRAQGTQQWDAQYYKKKYGSLAEAVKHSTQLAEQVSNEGIVLLKNDGTLPLRKGDAVTPYGYAYNNPVYSGTGAAATTNADNTTPEQGLKKYFSVDSTIADSTIKATPNYPQAAKNTPALDYDKTSLQAKNDAGKSARIYEYEKSIYEQAVKRSEKSSRATAIVFIARNGSEGIDKRQFAYADGTPHYLALTQAEKDMISVAKSAHDKVIVILNTANPMELSPLMSQELEVNAIVWMGTAGSRGFSALGNILSGNVNPSGRLSDIYPTDFTKDPTYSNWGQFGYSNINYNDTTLISSGSATPWPFVEYEEGIYVGYKYYETAAVEDSSFIYGVTDKQGKMAQLGAVAYPFGYGLSYTQFEQTLDNVTVDNQGNVSVNVTVKNVGSSAGKDVAQIYATLPYTQYDRDNGVEKATTQLVDFAKTKLLEPGTSQTLNMIFPLDTLTSYDVSHANSDGTKGSYILESGNYAIELKNNSHDVIDSETISVNQTHWFEGKNPVTSDKNAQSQLSDDGKPLSKAMRGQSYTAAHNQFQDMTDYMKDNTTELTRASWSTTQPTMPKNRTAQASENVRKNLERWKNFDVDHDEDLGNTSESKVYSQKAPVSRAENGLSLIDLRGVAYDDPQWDKLMDQLDFSGDKTDIQRLLFMAAYQTPFIKSIGKPITVDKDGAMGWSTSGASSWPSVNVMASTYDTQLMTSMGEAIGEEALQQGLTGWYAPAVNTHRSPFGGRVYEYYSEDGVLAGKLSAATISGAGNKGVISYLKHFAINEQEMNRSNYMATWANEQAIREIYLKPFQIAVESARSSLPYLTKTGQKKTKIIRSATAIMSAQNNIGTVIGFGRYSLQTSVLRGEWGFRGAVVTDMFMETLPQARDLSLRAGSDMYMIQMPGYNATDYDSPTSRMVMRQAVKNVAYATVNSNAMNDVTPMSTVSQGIAGWQKLLWVLDAFVVLIVGLEIWWIIRRGRRARRYPEQYKWPKKSKYANYSSNN